MEYAGVAEAGGVKLVARSLCEELSREGYNVTVIMPRFGCTEGTAFANAKDRERSTKIAINGKSEEVSFIYSALDEGVKIIFVCSPHFAQKDAVYTYTAKEEEECPEHKKGTGHEDARLLDTLLCKAAAYLIEHPDSMEETADIVLCQDAACAMVSVYLNHPAAKPAIPCVVTIHNAAPAYTHEFASLDEAEQYTGLSRQVLCGAFNGHTVEPYLLAAECAVLTTVSKQYADELMDKNFDSDTRGLAAAFHTRLIQIKGILNGIDYERYDPAGNESLLPYKFDASRGDFAGKWKCRGHLFKLLSENHSKAPPAAIYHPLSAEKSRLINPSSIVFCYHGRMVHQKGIKILYNAMRTALYEAARLEKDVFFIAMGQGEAELEDMMESLADDYKENAVYIKGYDKALSRLVIAASDFILLPSITEPCGQEDFIAQIYGTLPAAHATGGLKKIIDGKTGFLYEPNTPQTLSIVISNLIDMKETDNARLLSMAEEAARNVREHHSWKDAVQEGYLPLFNDLLRHSSS